MLAEFSVGFVIECEAFSDGCVIEQYTGLILHIKKKTNKNRKTKYQNFAIASQLYRIWFLFDTPKFMSSTHQRWEYHIHSANFISSHLWILLNLVTILHTKYSRYWMLAELICFLNVFYFWFLFLFLYLNVNIHWLCEKKEKHQQQFIDLLYSFCCVNHFCFVLCQTSNKPM